MLIENYFQIIFLILFFFFFVCFFLLWFKEHAAQAQPTKKSGKQHNILPLWGNEASMNLNPLILANIQGSSYFKGRYVMRTLFKILLFL